MKFFLNSYRPLILFPEGRQAALKYHLPPFIDYSCRKEPDFMSNYPSITGLCRVDKFAPRLHKGDFVIYITSKSSYSGLTKRHWRLTAILEVIERFESHSEAAKWYHSQNLVLPSNCMVEGNPPAPIDMTAPITEFGTNLRRWDAAYRQRAKLCGVFLACQPQCIELYNPAIITDEIMYEIFHRIPGMQNPPAISAEEFEMLKHLSHIQKRTLAK